MSELYSPIIFQTLAIALTALLLPKLKITSIFGAVGMVVGLSAVNQYIWSSNLFGSLPEVLSARSLVLLLSNGVIFYLLAKFLPGIEVEGILTAIIAPILFSILTIAIQKYAPLVDWGRVFQSTIDFIFDLKSYLLNQKSAPPGMVGESSDKGSLMAY